MNPRQTVVTLSPSAGGQEVGDPGLRNSRSTWTVPASGPKILNLGRAFLRRWKLLLLTVIVLNLAGFAGIHSLTPKYTASADLLVGPREEQVVDLKAVLSGLSGSSDVIESEIQVLRSREIARAVVQKLNLDQLTEFNPDPQAAGVKATVTAALTGAALWAKDQATPLLEMIGLPHLFDAKSATASSGIGSPGAEPLDPLSAPVDRFLGQLDVASKGRSRVITISFTSTDPTLAAKVPNAVADAYVANQLRAKTDATAQAHIWLDARVAELREQLLAADEAVEEYRRRAGIVPIRDSTLLNQQISEAGQELMRAHEQVALVEGRMSAVAKINPNALGLSREYAAAKAREQTLEDNLAKMRQQSDAGSQSEIGMRALQREADADRNLYDRLLARARETKIQSGLQQADANIISRAERPEEPSFPKPGIVMPLFLVASCLVGALLVVWLESLDRGFSNAEQLEATLGMPAIGAVPLIKRRLGRSPKPGEYCLDHPRSAFAEAIRSLHTSLMLADQDRVPKKVLIASALPGEGKSSVALAMATLMASCGKRVVIVDCDLRKPSVHKAFNVPSSPGLTDYLTQPTMLDAIVRQDPVSTAYFLTAGERTITAPDLFASDAMRNLLAALSETFDLVLLDGGPVLGVSDTRHLCRLADATVFVVRWQDTRCMTAWLGLRQLVGDGANVAGALLTMIDPGYYQKYSPVGIYRRRLALYLNA